MELEPSSSFVVTLVKKVEYKYQKLKNNQFGTEKVLHTF